MNSCITYRLGKLGQRPGWKIDWSRNKTHHGRTLVWWKRLVCRAGLGWPEYDNPGVFIPHTALFIVGYISITVP